LIDSPWEIIIHPAIRIEVSVSGKNLNFFNSKENLNFDKDEVYVASVKKIKSHYIKVVFNKDGFKEQGYISKNNLGLTESIEEHISLQDKIKVKILRYDYRYNNWILEAADQKSDE